MIITVSLEYWDFSRQWRRFWQFTFYTPDEVLAERDERLDEAGAASSLVVLASIEAAFQVDYLQRCYKKYRDQLSRSLRELYQTRGAKVSLLRDRNYSPPFTL